MTKSKFEVIVETVIRKRFEVEAKDADFAKIKAMGAKYYEGEVLSNDKRVESVEQTSPHYIVKTVGYESYVIDVRRCDGIVAACNDFKDAVRIKDALNAEEEETQ